MESKGRFIAIEGTDGSGKETQCAMLCKRLRDEGMSAVQVDFPMYGKPSAWFVERYLAGDCGPSNAFDPKLTSTFYALDRLWAASKIRAYLQQGQIVIANRYVPSSMGHQSAKLKTAEEREKLIRWIYWFEYDICKIPKPDLNMFLRVPVGISFELVKKRNQAKGLSGDIHENDINHLRQAAISYDQVCSIYNQEFAVIECSEANQLRPKEEIHDLIMQALVVHGALGF